MEAVPRSLGQGLECILHPTFEIVSPVPLRLGLGVKPQPESVFGEGFSRSSSGPAGKESQLADSFPSVIFFREGEGGVRIYSLTGDFSEPLGKEKRAVDEVNPSSRRADRGEVWGARIALVEKELGGWTRDSGVVLALFGIVGLIVIMGVLGFIVRIARRKL